MHQRRCLRWTFESQARVTGQDAHLSEEAGEDQLLWDSSWLQHQGSSSMLDESWWWRVADLLLAHSRPSWRGTPWGRHLFWWGVLVLVLEQLDQLLRPLCFRQVQGPRRDLESLRSPWLLCYGRDGRLKSMKTRGCWWYTERGLARLLSDLELTLTFFAATWISQPRAQPPQLRK